MRWRSQEKYLKIEYEAPEPENEEPSDQGNQYFRSVRNFTISLGATIQTLVIFNKRTRLCFSAYPSWQCNIAYLLDNTKHRATSLHESVLMLLYECRPYVPLPHSGGVFQSFNLNPEYSCAYSFGESSCVEITWHPRAMRSICMGRGRGPLCRHVADPNDVKNRIKMLDQIRKKPPGIGARPYSHVVTWISWARAGSTIIKSVATIFCGE